MGGRLLEGRPW
jgi:hypothetical protein